MNEKPLEVGRTYLAKHTTRQVKARVTVIRHRIDVNTLAQEPAQRPADERHRCRGNRNQQPAFLRSVRAKPHHRQLHFDRRALQRNRRRRNDPRDDLSQQAANRESHAPNATIARQNRVAAHEKFERHGHHPASSYLPATIIDFAERALFDDGFETILLDASRIPSAAIATVLDSLRSVGLIVLLADRKSHPRNPRSTRSTNRRSLLPLSRGNKKRTRTSRSSRFRRPNPALCARSSAIQRQTKMTTTPES